MRCDNLASEMHVDDPEVLASIPIVTLCLELPALCVMAPTQRGQKALCVEQDQKHTVKNCQKAQVACGSGSASAPGMSELPQ